MSATSCRKIANNYEILNKYFRKNYKLYMRAWSQINKEYAVWFPYIHETNEEPKGKFGGTKNCVNILTHNGMDIFEYDYSKSPDEDTRPMEFNQKRFVFGKIGKTIQFLGVFVRTPYRGEQYLTYKYVRIAREFDTDTLFSNDMQFGNK
ncbi:MAG: hypothetical protein GX481_08635 [Atopobium sp.]|nr:hypothetical protein [Atopobium sp.]